MGTNYYFFDEEKNSVDSYPMNNGSVHICKTVTSNRVIFYISRDLQINNLKKMDKDSLLVIDEYGTRHTPKYLLELIENRVYTEDDHEFF